MDLQKRPDITQNITQGAKRALYDLGFASIMEFTLKIGRRADICGINEKGEIIILEVKSSIEDFKSDNKWHEYKDYCDYFYFALDCNFPINLIPDDIGYFICDRFGGQIIRPANLHKLSAPRRKSVTLQFARQAAFKNCGQC
jgi:hypothetical protein